MPNPPAFFDKHPPHIKETVLQMAPHSTTTEIVAHLKTLGVYANDHLVGRLRRDNGVKSGWHEHIVPAETFEGRIRQYIDAVRVHDGEVWSNRYLGLRGRIWSPCAAKLCEAGMIERVDDRRPSRYTQIVADYAVDEWYSEEVIGR